MKSDRRLTFVIADDHLVYRDAVKAIIEENGFEVIGEASDGDEAVRLCQNLEPDMAVLDVSMPRLNGIDAAREIKDARPNTKIVLLTIHAEDQYILSGLHAGAAAYVTKTRAASNLLEAIATVCRGETYVSAARGHPPYHQSQS